MDEQDTIEIRVDAARIVENGPGGVAPAGETEPLADVAAATEPLPVSPPQGTGPDAEEAVLSRFWAVVRRLPTYLRLAASLARDPRVPRRAKVYLAVGGVYMISPLDLIPGIIPIAGQLDDLAVFLLALRQATRACPPDVAATHLAQAGLTAGDIDTDLAAIRDTVRWLAVKGYRAGRRAGSRLWTRARRIKS